MYEVLDESKDISVVEEKRNVDEYEVTIKESDKKLSKEFFDDA